MKLNIAVCDDLKEERVKLARMLKAYCQQKDIESQISLYASGKELLSSLRVPGQINILFLDIYMPDYSGVDTARDLRKLDRRCAIVFVTTSTDHGLESYEVEASDYLVKPVAQEDVARAMDWYLEHMPEELRTLHVYSDGEWMDFPLSSILYIEILDHQSYIHMENRTVVVRRGINDLASSIDSEDFLRCHRSYLVNLNFVKGIENRDFRLTDDTLIPIRAGSLNKTREDFINWTYKKVWSRP